MGGRDVRVRKDNLEFDCLADKEISQGTCKVYGGAFNAQCEHTGDK